MGINQFNFRRGRAVIQFVVPTFEIGKWYFIFQPDTTFQFGRYYHSIYTSIDCILFGFGLSITIESKDKFIKTEENHA
jgi:hypothetical protein